MPPRSPLGIGTRSTRQHIASAMSPNPRPGDPVLARNRRASHEHHLLEFLEAGIQLTGTEVKALRAGLAHLREGYVRVENGEAWLIQVHIGQDEMGNRQNPVHPSSQSASTRWTTDRPTPPSPAAASSCTAARSSTWTAGSGWAG